MNLIKTLDEFNQEYAELSKKGRFNDNYLGPITDIYIKNAQNYLNYLKNNAKYES